MRENKELWLRSSIRTRLEYLSYFLATRTVWNTIDDTYSSFVQGLKYPYLSGFTHWVNRSKHGLGFKPYFGKSGEYWVIKYFECSDIQKCANLWILRQVRLLDNKENITYVH